MKILGISAYYHDSAAALVEDGRIVAAAQEERFTRKKHDPGFPFKAIEYCLGEGKINLGDVDYIAFYEKPFLKFERLLETYMAFAPRGFSSFKTAIPVWIKEKLFQKGNLIQALGKIEAIEGIGKKLLFAEHHQSHAASAFYPSPYKESAVLTMDGVGEWATTSLSLGSDSKLKMIREIHFPHSLGLLYSAFTYYTGFKVNSGEYKVMGLAPYGNPKYVDIIYNNLIDLKEDGTFRLNMKYFDYCTGLTMTNGEFDKLFGGPARTPEALVTQKEMDLAASIQVVCEEVMLRLSRSIRKETGSKNLCLAGGVALNCVGNGKILKEKIFENIWIQPAAGDAGGALGAALATYYDFLGNKRKVDAHDSMNGAYLGPNFSQSEIESRLRSAGVNFKVYSDSEIIQKTVDSLASEKAIGWFQGRMEFGPRSLGARSIIADARSPLMQKNLNLKVKFRESFRPFAPAVLAENVNEWFDMDEASPYMLLVTNVVKNRQRQMSSDENNLFGIDKLNVLRSDIPAVTHIDYSARVQTVHKETNERFHTLISEFGKKTGSPVLVNTSFNVRGEPIVCTPEDAFRCLMGTGIDVLVVGNCWVERTAQDPSLQKDYKNEFSLD